MSDVKIENFFKFLFFVFVKSIEGTFLFPKPGARNMLLRYDVLGDNVNANKQSNYNALETGSWCFIFHVYIIIFCITRLDTEITLF